MKLRLNFELLLGADLPGVPPPAEVPGEMPPPHPEGILRIPQSAVFSDESGRWEGVYTHPHWGELPAENVSISRNHIAFSAPSGNDDKGGQTAYFNFSFTRTDGTDDVVGFSAGQKPFYRSYLLAVGKVKGE